MKIVCFGDSLTRGVTFVNNRLKIVKNNYPKVLQELFSKTENNTLVMNKGVFNDNSDLLRERLQRDVIDEKPDYCIIEIGGNDCDFMWGEVAKNPEATHIPTVPLDRYMNNLQSILTKVKSEGINPILTTLPPLDPVRYYKRITDAFSSKVSDWICKVGGIEYWHSKYNLALQKIADELDVFCIDVRNAINCEGDLQELISDDGIHLTEKGYQCFASEVFRKL